MARKPRARSSAKPPDAPETEEEPSRAASLAPALVALALELERADDIFACVKVLETLVANAKTRAKCLPSAEARARIKLASLLMTHTDNCARAKMHLEAAQVLLKPLKRCEELQVHGLSLLGRCYKMMGSEYRRQRFQATQRGLQMSIGMRERLPEDATWTMWTFHYYLEHADACATEEDWSGCESYLAAGLNIVKAIHGDKGSRMEVLFAMAQLQRALAQRASGSEDAHVFAASEAADRAMTKMLNEKEAKENPEETSRLRFHYAVIRTLGKLMEGDPVSAANDPRKLKSLINEVKSSNESAYNWLPDPAAFALAKYLSAEVVRPIGNLTEAMVYLNEAKDLVDDALHELGVLPQGGEAPVLKEEREDVDGEDEDDDDEGNRLWVTCEDEMQPRVAQDARPYLYLRVLILESIVSISLTSTKYEIALDLANQLMDMLETYPRTLSVMASHVEMVVGHALQSLGKYKEASAHFARSASVASTPNWREIGILCSALAISCEDDEEAASRALEMVKPILREHKEKKEKKNSSTLLNQTLAFFASGCTLLTQGRMEDAKNHLARALKRTHEHAGNEQMLASCLRLICEINVDYGNTADTETLAMAESAFALARKEEDLPLQVAAINDVVRILTTMVAEDPDGKITQADVDKYAEYERRKVKQLDDFMTALAASDECTARLARLEAGVGG